MITIALATSVVLLASWLLLFRHRRRPSDTQGFINKNAILKPPPCVPGLPLLGNALPLGKQGADYLHECWERYGDAFTLHAAGQKMTFLFAPCSLVYYFRAPESELSFLPAVEQWTERVFGLPPADFLPRHHLILTSTRNLVGRSGGENIQHHAAKLIPLLRKGISKWLDESSDDNNRVEKSNINSEQWKTIELGESIAKLVFAASVEALFGSAFLQRHGESYLYQAFFEFETCFELAASPIPHFLQPKFKKARKKLLEAFRKSLSGDFLKESTVVGDLIQVSGMPPHAVPNMLLAVLWASQANTVPTAFWTLGFLLLPENKEKYLTEIRASLNRIHDGRTDDGFITIGKSNNNTDDVLISLSCDSKSLLSKCCMEALRLRSASTDVRIAAKDFKMPLYSKSTLHIDKNITKNFTQKCTMNGASVVPPSNKTEQSEEQHKDHTYYGNGDQKCSEVLIEKGTMVMICPWISHVDPRLYEDQPEVFNPHRQGAALPSLSSNSSGNKATTLNREVHGVAAGVGGVGGLAFGGGKFRCPGRSFAEMELGLVVGLVLDELDIELIEDSSPESGKGVSAAEVKRKNVGARTAPGDPNGLLPAPNVRRLVGIKVPDGPCWVRIRKRKR